MAYIYDGDVKAKIEYNGRTYKRQHYGCSIGMGDIVYLIDCNRYMIMDNIEDVMDCNRANSKYVEVYSEV